MIGQAQTHNIAVPMRIVRTDQSGKQKLCTFLICLAILIQYAIVIMRETLPSLVLTVDLHDNLFLMLMGVNVLLYIAVVALSGCDSKRLLLFCVAVLYLTCVTLAWGKGFLTLLNVVGVLIALLFFTEMRFDGKTKRTVIVFSLICFAAVYFTSPYNGEFYHNIFYSNCYINRNLMATTTLVNMYLALSLFTRRRRGMRLSYLIVYGLSLAVILQTTSRTSLAGWGLITLFHIFSVYKRRINRKKLYRFFEFVLFVSLVGVFVIAYVLPQYLTNVRIMGRTFVSSRDIIYRDAFETLFSGGRWLFGNGFGEFTTTKALYGGLRTNAHNQWLQFLLNYGLIFLIFMVYVYLKVFKSVIKSSDFSKETLFFVLMQSALFVMFIVESIHYQTEFQFIWLAIYVVNGKTSQKRISERSNGKKSIAR